MTPQVVTEPTLHQYGSTIRRADGSELVLNMPQPFFHVRSITTQIQIYDGATVVMGGLITEDLKKVDDRIPVLGDLPLLGGLFRSTSEMSQKRNLLIFVTARLVDPAGRPIRSPQAASSTTAATPGSATP
jgi:general secretion pathway protein D